MPPGLGALSGDAGCDRYEGWLIWIGRRQGDLNAGFEFLDANGDFEERPTQRFEGGLAPERAPRRGLADLMQQPIGAGVQEEAELVGFPAVAGGAIGLGVEFVVLDHVFHPAAGAIDLLVEHLGPTGQVGDHEADVAALRGRLDAGDDLALWPRESPPASGKALDSRGRVGPKDSWACRLGRSPYGRVPAARALDR